MTSRPGKKRFYFFPATGKQSGGKWEVIIGPCVPIILCATLLCADREVQPKWRTPRVAKKNKVDEIADWIWHLEACWFPRVKTRGRRKSDGPTKKKKKRICRHGWTGTNTHLWHFLGRFVNRCYAVTFHFRICFIISQKKSSCGLIAVMALWDLDIVTSSLLIGGIF